MRCSSVLADFLLQDRGVRGALDRGVQFPIFLITSLMAHGRLKRQAAAETNTQYGNDDNNNDNNGSRWHFTFLVSGLDGLSA